MNINFYKVEGINEIMVDNREYEVMKRYWNAITPESRGCIVEYEERAIIEILSSVGLMSYGFHNQEDGKIVDTAHLTEFGMKIYKRERIRRTPWRRFLFNCIHGR